MGSNDDNSPNDITKPSLERKQSIELQERKENIRLRKKMDAKKTTIKPSNEDQIKDLTSMFDRVDDNDYKDVLCFSHNEMEHRKDYGKRIHYLFIIKQFDD